MTGLADYREVWVVDFEYQAPAGETPAPVCLVGRELHSGRRIALWRDDLRRRLTAPFDTGPEVLVVAYFASAEMSCFLALGWPVPQNLICLFAEHRVETNGLKLEAYGNSLLDAAAMRGLPVMEAATKESMRRLVMDQQAWSASEAEAVIAYCDDDVMLSMKLLARMTPAIDYPRALLRGRYMIAVARMERAGVPIDFGLHRRVVDNWIPLKGRLIEAVDDAFDVYEGNSFRSDRFAAYLARAGIPWPRYPSGQLILDDDTFRSQSRAYPEVYPLRQLRTTLSGLRLTGLTVGRDGRNRCLLSPFGTVTGRNTPSNSKYIFGPAKWMRHLIKPPEGCAVAYIDWVSQELGIAAALSGDERMIEAYATGDPYIGFARQSGLVPADATKATHGAVRERVKIVCLGVLYGMRPPTMAAQLGIPPCHAAELLRLHKRTYPRFWRWSEAIGSAAFARSRIVSVLGWPMRITGQTKPTRVFNFPMQANGAEMMRLAAIAATEAGIEVCGPIHDAFLICAPTNRIGSDAVRMERLMRRAGEKVAGIPINVEVAVVPAPHRYSDPKGAQMFNKINEMLTVPA